MARRTAAAKADTHERIVEHAAAAFRAHGTGVGIGEVMQDLGLTHGGFYRHFGSKDDLLVEALTRALDEISERLAAIAADAPPGRALAAIVDAYLSEDHVRHPEAWCALAALAPEIGRQPAEVRARLDAAMLRYLERLAPYLPGATVDEKRGAFLILFSGMSGAVAMIRALGDATLRAQMLETARRYYLATFAGV